MTFFGPHLYLAEKYCENPKVPGAQLNVNPARAITWLVGVTIYCTFFNNNSPSPSPWRFSCNKIRLKKLNYSKGNAHWTKFWWSPGRICTPITGCFHDKTKISTTNFQVDCFLPLKYCRRQCTLLSLTWAKSVTKFISKMQYFKRFLDLNSKQKKNWAT